MIKDEQKDNEDKELDDFAEEVKENKDSTPPATQSKEEEKKKYKTIDIDWDQIPYIFNLKAKMKKALELDLEHVPGEETFIVKNGAGPHTVTENSCDCKDWEVNGTSINPCKHMIRVKFTIEELKKMLGKVSPDIIINGKVKNTQKPKKEEVQKVKQQEIAVVNREEEDLLTIPDIAPALAEIGKIKTGGHSDRATQGYRIPTKWDHFKIGSMLKDENGEVIIDEELTAIIGENCKELDISLCFDIPALNIPNFYAFFKASKLQCRGNGKKAYRRNEEGELDEIKCDRKNCQFAKEKKCKPYAKLSVILEGANRVGGVFVLRTTSYNSIRNLISSMAFISNATGGILAGLPLKLRLMPATVIPNGLNKKVVIYVTNIEYAGTITELKEDAHKEIDRRLQLGFNMRKLEQSQQKLITKQATEEAEENAEDIENEFYVNGDEE
jgi:hypothetical protein